MVERGESRNRERLDAFAPCARGERAQSWSQSQVDSFAAHVADSAQCWPVRRSPTASWVDLGSGAGSGLVVGSFTRAL